MFAKFVCAIALVASTGAMAESATWEEAFAAKATAVPTAGIKEIYVDEISRGGWSRQARARYDSWMEGFNDLNTKNCITPVHYKVDFALCAQIDKLMGYVNDTMKIILSNNGLTVGEK